MSTKKQPKAKPVSRRDNFSSSAIQILYKRVGGKCCRCKAATFGPQLNDPSKTVNIGQAAHIAAAAPGGPRYDPKMSPEERSSTTNGMWMCSNCHDIIDRDVDDYPTAKLKQMRKRAEQKAKALMGVGTVQATDETDSVCVGVSAATIMDIRKAKAEIRATNGAMLSETQAEELLESVNYIDPVVDTYLVDVGRELTAFYDQLIAHCNTQAIVLEVVRRLKILSESFHAQWREEDVEIMCRVSKRLIENNNSRSRAYQSGAALLKDLTKFPALKDNNFHKIPLRSLRDLRVSGFMHGDSDYPDGAPPPKRAYLDSTDSPFEAAGGPPIVRTEGMYIGLMEQLSTCENEEEAESIEERLIEMGYEPEVY